MIQHHISAEQIEWLERKFAKLTWRGWVIPEWIELLKICPNFHLNKRK